MSVSVFIQKSFKTNDLFFVFQQNKNPPQFRSEYNVYSTFQSHEPEFDYLKSLEIEEKINKIRWLPQKNAAQFLLSTNGKFLFLIEPILINRGSEYIDFEYSH